MSPLSTGCHFLHRALVVALTITSTLSLSAQSAPAPRPELPCDASEPGNCIANAESLVGQQSSGESAEKAGVWYDIACSNPDPAWCALAARSAAWRFSRGSDPLAGRLFRKACDKGNVAACNLLAGATGDGKVTVSSDFPVIPPRCASKEPLSFDLTVIRPSMLVVDNSSAETPAKFSQKPRPQFPLLTESISAPYATPSGAVAGRHIVNAIRGEVKVIFLIDATGSVTTPFVICSDHQQLTLSVMNAIHGWHADPARYHGEPAASVSGFTYKFTVIDTRAANFEDDRMSRDLAAPSVGISAMSHRELARLVRFSK